MLILTSPLVFYSVLPKCDSPLCYSLIFNLFLVFLSAYSHRQKSPIAESSQVDGYMTNSPKTVLNSGIGNTVYIHIILIPQMQKRDSSIGEIEYPSAFIAAEIVSIVEPIK